MDSYWWLCFRTSIESLELDQDRLFETGATGIEEVEEASTVVGDASTGPEALNRSGVLVKGFFGTAGEMQAAREFFKDRKDLTHGEEKIEDWDRSWRDRQTPVEVTANLVVMPPWVDAPAGGRHVIRLEAKMAFGTGSHESTRIAANLLERVPLQGGSVVDIGAGTGILALYAAQLGATSVLALDIDPVVGPCMNENLILNPVPAGCRFRTLIGGTGTLKGNARFSVVICNMIRTELWPFREELRSRLLPGGSFLVSGQRLEDKQHFFAWRETSPFRIGEEVEMDGWWGFAATVDR
ncbi:MAG: 50S ribosomal protein L11 methyltransferase [Fibrobacteria bacterium]